MKIILIYIVFGSRKEEWGEGVKVCQKKFS